VLVEAPPPTKRLACFRLEHEAFASWAQSAAP